MKYLTLSVLTICLAAVMVFSTGCPSGGGKTQYVPGGPPPGEYDLGDMSNDSAGNDSGTITSDKPIDSYLFNLTGQADFIAYAWASAGSSANVMLRLFDQNNTLLQTDSASAGGVDPYFTRKNLAAGRYRLEVFPEGGTLGEYGFSIVTRPGDLRLDFGEYTGADCASDTATLANPTDRWVYTLALDVPLSVTLDVTQTNIDGYITVSDAKTGFAFVVGEAMQTVDLSFPPLAAGLYFIVVRDDTSAKSGSYDLTVNISP